MGQTYSEFIPFQVTVAPGRRYWEDESTGVLLKTGQTVMIGPRQFRSNELRFALIRSQVLIKTGEAVFAFRANTVKVTPGPNNKNIVEDLNKLEAIITEVKQDEPKKHIPENIQKKEKSSKKEINASPKLDEIPDMEEIF